MAEARRSAIQQRFTGRSTRWSSRSKEDRSDPRRHPVRQPVARHGLGEVRHRPGARDHRRQARSSRRTWRSYADGVNVHAFLMPRAEFRKMVEGSVRNSFMHSFLAKGRLLYTHDPTIADLCARLREIGERDTQVQLLRAATQRAAGDRQGPQVVRHARRPRLHRALDSLRRDAAGADRGDRRAACWPTAR